MDINRKPEDFSTRYTVEYGICERCMKRPYDIAIASLERPIVTYDKRAIALEREITAECQVPVFAFVADCGGDAISLCAGCLQDILLEMQALEAGVGSSSVHYEHAGKLGPWARRGMRGTRYLAVGLQGQHEYARIESAEKSGGSWRYVLVKLEGDCEPHSHGANTNTYARRSNV